ncbi:hypothetical protein [Bradyrhizobium pachyrhizi]|uniref:hypothetical protein n=1 Tax=Bradyrhizobium pachyrhizi TaxID=280333 RepID=UPI00067DC7A1|nr:hypothetical protein [Bradyrhizobium pachyrhizi]
MSGYLCLTIEKMPQGGFVVFEGRGSNAGMNSYCGPLFACTAIGEALDFMKGQLVPPVASVNVVLVEPPPEPAPMAEERCEYPDAPSPPAPRRDRAEMRKSGNYV